MIRRLFVGAVLLATLGVVLYLALGTGRSVVTYTPDAVGQTGVIFVVTDSVTWNGPVGEAIRDELGRGLATLPQPEPAFTLSRQDLTEGLFPRLRRQHALLIAGPYTRPSTTGQFLRARLDSAGVAALERGGNGIFFRPNLWASRQLVVYATGPDDEAVAAQIRARGAELRRAFDGIARQRMTREMFERGRQRDIEERLLDGHGFAVNVQHDYVLVRDTTFATDAGTRGTFVRLRRIAGSDSWRDLFIYYEDDPRLERLNRESVLGLREELTRRFIRGADDTTYIRVEDRFPDRRPVVTDSVNLSGRFALETRGTWYLGTAEGRSAGMGGPFVNYAFYDEDSGRFFMIDGMVFAPRYDKREFLRQMETIAHTFRTRDDDFAVTDDRIAGAD